MKLHLKKLSRVCKCKVAMVSYCHGPVIL